MRLVLHRRICSDVDEIMDFYQRAEHPELAEEFYHELHHFMQDAARRPYRNHFFKADLRRANLKRFPYHFLYRVVGDWRAYSRCPAPSPRSRLWRGARIMKPICFSKPPR
jgi:hypothetical protein